MSIFGKIINNPKTKSEDNTPHTARKSKKGKPSKPWGKKERLVIFFTLIITAGVSILLYLQARSWKLPGLPRIKLPSVNSLFFTEKIIILEGNNGDRSKHDKTITKFKDKTRNLSGVWGFYVIKLNSKKDYGVNQNEIFQAASLIKLPVMLTMHIEAEAQNINLDEIHSLKSSDKIKGAGSLYSKPEGFEITYRDLVHLMGKQSDNTAYNICKNMLSEERINQTIREIGMEKTNLSKNSTTPQDIGLFFVKLMNSKLVSTKSRDEILESLTDTIYEKHLKAGIPDDVRVAHKYGREARIVNDAGIVYTDEPFILVIMSKGVIEQEADEIFPELSKIIYEGEMQD